MTEESQELAFCVKCNEEIKFNGGSIVGVKDGGRGHNIYAYSCSKCGEHVYPKGRSRWCPLCNKPVPMQYDGNWCYVCDGRIKPKSEDEISKLEARRELQSLKFQKEYVEKAIEYYSKLI